MRILLKQLMRMQLMAFNCPVNSMKLILNASVQHLWLKYSSSSAARWRTVGHFIKFGIDARRQAMPRFAISFASVNDLLS
jgi:hypothetical protein